MKRWIWILAAVLPAVPALAVEPELAAYVTDDDRDVYVALYGDVAVELAGCPTEASARSLLGLGAGAPLREETFDGLTRDFELGAHPRIPCGDDAAFDADLEATTPIWADLTGTRRYYLPGPQGGGIFYSIPTRCEAIKTAFAIRQRINLPGVLRAQEPPSAGEMMAEHVLDCGSSTGGGPAGGGSGGDGATRWSLHRADVFLSELSVGDSIYVAVLTRTVSGAVEKSYLPIYRLDGRPAGELIWAGGATTARTEAALVELFGSDPEAGVGQLPGDEVARLDSQVFVDLCLENCEGYVHQHAVFALPGIDFELTMLPAPEGRIELDLLGEARTRWEVAEGRSATFAGCPDLSAALGLGTALAEAPDWAEALEQAIGAADSPAAAFTCRGTGADLCVRRVADGASLSAAMLVPGADCSGATRLRLELGATVRSPSALVLNGGAFAEVEILPADTEARATLQVTPTALGLDASVCLFSDVHGLLGVRGLDRLTLRRVDLVRAGQEPTGPEVTGLVVESTTLALDAVEVGRTGAGRVPFERALRLCNARAYAVGGHLEGSALAVQGMNAELSLVGRGEAPSTVASGNFGLFLMTGSEARLHEAEVGAPTAVVLRGAELDGSRTALASGAEPAAGTGLRLERGARADLFQSTARGFACLGLFRDATASARFVLPGNDLAADNTRVSCGLNQVEVLE